MKFLDLHERLRLETWRRIDLGILSSGLLARQTGLAQAHISNFLHGRRRLSLPALDRILVAESLSIDDLAAFPHFPAPHAARQSSVDVVPVISQLLAVTAPVIPPRAPRDFLELPQGWLSTLPARRAVSRRTWDRFVGVRITAAQALPMDPLLRSGSIVVIDRHYNSLQPFRPPHPNICGIRLGARLSFRHVSLEANRLILRPRSPDFPVELIELADRESPSDFIVGRVCLSVAEL